MLTALTLSLALQAEEPVRHRPPAETAELVEAIRERLGDELRDAASAEIRITRPARWASLVADPRPIEGYVVCATVNAKNAYGAYVGREPWVFVWWSRGERQGINAIPVRTSVSVPPVTLAYECEQALD